MKGTIPPRLYQAMRDFLWRLDHPDGQPAALRVRPESSQGEGLVGWGV
jgi:hypothetical protein